MEKDRIAIFMADDAPDDMCLFKDALLDLGINHDLTWFRDGELLLNNLNTTNFVPEMVFLDLNMPKMSGMDCLKEIRKSDKFKDVIVVIYSTSSDHYDIENSFDAGANHYLTKPNTYLKLKESLYQLLQDNFLIYQKESGIECCLA